MAKDTRDQMKMPYPKKGAKKGGKKAAPAKPTKKSK